MHAYPAEMSQFVLWFPTVQPGAHEPPTHNVPAVHAVVFPLDEHAPAPLQTPAVVNWEWVSAGQVVGAVAVQVDALHSSQLALALHLPSVPHPLLAVTAHRAWGSTTPAPTA